MNNYILIEPHYFPNIQYFTKLLNHDELMLDDESFFHKQSYRNRCYISGPNKVHALIVPVNKGKTLSPMKDVTIDYSTKWVAEHWNSILSSYNNSSWFLYYRDVFEEILRTKFKYLIDLNQSLIESLLKILELNIHVNRLSNFNRNTDFNDFRNKIHPKSRYNQADPLFFPFPYQQVFIERFNFLSNLSIIDLIFNEGPEAQFILKKSTLYNLST